MRSRKPSHQKRTSSDCRMWFIVFRIIQILWLMATVKLCWYLGSYFYICIKGPLLFIWNPSISITKIGEILWGKYIYTYIYIWNWIWHYFFSPSCDLFSVLQTPSTNKNDEQVERIPCKFSALLCVYYDCFSCYAIHFWFKYLMTLIKQHLNFLWDPASVPLDHIMSNNGWNELRWRGCSSVSRVLQLFVMAWNTSIELQPSS